jgi:flagellar motor switch/type III secretory pathway protein FliN
MPKIKVILHPGAESSNLIRKEIVLEMVQGSTIRNVRELLGLADGALIALSNKKAASESDMIMNKATIEFYPVFLGG